METLKHWLCWLLFAGHGYDVMDAGPVYATVRCRRCKYVRRM